VCDFRISQCGEIASFNAMIICVFHGGLPYAHGLHLRDYSERILRQLHTHAHTVPFDRGSVERDISIMKHVPYTKSRLVQELRNSDPPAALRTKR